MQSADYLVHAPLPPIPPRKVFAVARLCLSTLFSLNIPLEPWRPPVHWSMMATNRTELDVMDHLRRFETRALLNSCDPVVLGTTFDIVTRRWGHLVIKKNLKLMRGYRYSVICAGTTDLDDYRIHAKGKAIMYLSLTYSYRAQEGRLLWRGRPFPNICRTPHRQNQHKWTIATRVNSRNQSSAFSRHRLYHFLL